MESYGRSWMESKLLKFETSATGGVFKLGDCLEIIMPIVAQRSMEEDCTYWIVVNKDSDPRLFFFLGNVIFILFCFFVVIFSVLFRRFRISGFCFVEFVILKWLQFGMKGQDSLTHKEKQIDTVFWLNRPAFNLRKTVEEKTATVTNR